MVITPPPTVCAKAGTLAANNSPAIASVRKLRLTVLLTSLHCNCFPGRLPLEVNTAGPFMPLPPEPAFEFRVPVAGDALSLLQYPCQCGRSHPAARIHGGGTR